MHVFEAATGRVASRFDGAGALTCLARWVVGGDHDLTVHGWRLPSGDDVRMRGFPAKISTLAFDDTGRWQATPAAADVPLWDFSAPGPSNRHPVTALAWQPGATTTLLTGDTAGTLALWQLRGHERGDTIRPVWTEESGDPVTTVAFAGERAHVVGRHSGMATPYRLDSWRVAGVGMSIGLA